MKKIYLSILLSLVCVLSLVSCKDDVDSVAKTQLNAPTLTTNAKTVSSLAFSWNAVEGATQYAYELYDASGKVVLGDVTTTTSVVATGLADNATYTLKVWAYAALTGDKSTSPIAELTETTNRIVPLANPNPTAETGNGSVTITWPEVENAASYSYSYVIDGETKSGSTTSNSVTLRGLTTGDYTVYVTAVSGEEAYSNSEPIAVTFHCVSKNELWRKAGKYYAANLDQYFDATIVAYDDGTYTIEAPYGEKGYDISFSVDETSTAITFTNASSTDEWGYSYLYLNSQNYYIAAYTAGGYSSFEAGSNKDKGEVWFFTYLYDGQGNSLGSYGYDDFVWDSESEGGLTVDDLCGTYTSTDTGYDYTIDWSNWTSIEQSETVTITKVDDTTITISNFYGWEENVKGTVDLDAKTITLELKTDWGGGYYTLCQYDEPTKAVVGTIADDGSITFENYTAYYPGYTFSYLYNMKSVLSKQ